MIRPLQRVSLFLCSLNYFKTKFLARERAEGFARNLKIAEHHVDAAVRFFKLGLAHNFSRGRKAEVTMAVCLYASCRLEKTSHMLIDFTDIAEVFLLLRLIYRLIKLFTKYSLVYLF